VSLREQAAAGVKWSGVSTVVNTGLQFLQIAVLARVLGVEKYGLISTILVVIGFTQQFADMGLSNAIIHRQDATRDQLSSLYWLNLLAGAALCILVWVATPGIIAFYAEPRLHTPLMLAALIFLVVPLGQQFQILLQKELHFYRLARIEVFAYTMSSGVAIVSALVSQSILAIVWSYLALAITRAVLLMNAGWHIGRPRLHFKYADLQGYLSFGLYQMGERSINYFSANIDYVIIGRFLGQETLGFYTLAYQLVVFPVLKINPIITRVAFPVFARKQTDNAALQYGYLEVTRLLASLLFPLLIGLGVTSPLFIPIVFGAEWLAAVPLVQVLVVLGMFVVVSNPAGALWMAKGRADIGFAWNVCVAIINTLVFLLVVSAGVYAVAWAHVSLKVLYFILMWGIFYYLIRLDFRQYIMALHTPLLFSLAMGAAVYLGYVLLEDVVTVPLVLLIGLVLFGGLVYIGLYLLFQRAYVLGLWQLLVQKRQPVA
jgi:O-antigen/teichoic acid export membrane protein